jgi:hypothetical protein
MYKSLIGIAGAAMLFVVAAPAPADAFVARHAPGFAQDQANVEHVWHRGYPHRRWYGPRVYRYGPRVYRRAYPYRVYPGPYAYAPYPYYRRYHYGPRPFVQFGPFGFGIW